MTPAPSPRVFRNRWGVLTPPAVGAWSPTLTVSVVIPAWNAHDTLPAVLAALSEQSYPADLMEVIVVDDGSPEPIELPALRPHATCLLRTRASWGRAHACDLGAREAKGDVVHWLDADMICDRTAIEAAMRWHHLIDHAVVLGQKTFVEPPAPLPAPMTIADAVRADDTRALFASCWSGPHDWVEKVLSDTQDLRTSKFRGYMVHTGASASVRRDLLLQAGGLPSGLKLGEDIELGYRLQMLGAVFIPDRSAHSWHLGRTQVMQRQDAVNRYNEPFLADLVPDLRRLRRAPGRTYSVSHADIIVEADDHPYEQVAATVDALLGGRPHDITVHLVAPWATSDERRRPLEDDVDLRMLHAGYAHDGRVALVDQVPASSFPAMFRVHMPVGVRTGPSALHDLTTRMQKSGLGLLQVLMPDGVVVRIERVAAAERTKRLIRPDEHIDDVINDVAGAEWVDGSESGFSLLPPNDTSGL